MYLAFFVIRNWFALSLSRSLAPVVAIVVRSMHAFALFSGIQRHAAAMMTETTATAILLLRMNI